jgi:hypothetical protein
LTRASETEIVNGLAPRVDIQAPVMTR